MSVLQLVGLRPTLRTARDDAHAPGTVLATIPAAGSSIDTGASVVVIVAAPSDDVPGGGSSPPTDPSATPTTPTPSGTPSAP